MLGGVSLNVRSGGLQHRHRSQRVWLCVALRWISSNEVDYALLHSCFMTFTQSSFSKELDYLFSETPLQHNGHSF